jgi:DNA-binding transcriptional MerR regulator
MEILKERYSITELSERLNITDHALRYYEKEFKMNIPKDERGRRYYTPDLANMMYQIKAMRDEGLEIKAIKKIMQSEYMVNEPPAVVVDNKTDTLVPNTQTNNYIEIKQFFDEFKEQIACSVSQEVNSAREHLSKEMTKSKLELGASFENSIRKLECKMERHFSQVDQSLSSWRERNRYGIVTRFVHKLFK